MLNKIKKIIIDDGRSIYEIAKKSGLTYSLVHNIVNGKTKKTIRLETAFKLADALGVDVNEFREKES
ncbi:helix-turn-helix domain-containing protein [Facklamia sp. P12955]|uniref:helix-turn-helix domain-containing protein n=1 Tax=Facklamia sp. P12955 TaxID=3421946 RepID=UPI003D172266